MTKIKSLLLAAALLLAGNSLQAQTVLPDGLMDAKTRQNPHWPENVPYFSVAALPDGNVLIAFVVQGQGRWWLYENCPGCPDVLLAAGKATVKNDIHYVIVPGDTYLGCYINLENVHGYAGPEL